MRKEVATRKAIMHTANGYFVSCTDDYSDVRVRIKTLLFKLREDPHFEFVVWITFLQTIFVEHQIPTTHFTQYDNGSLELFIELANRIIREGNPLLTTSKGQTISDIVDSIQPHVYVKDFDFLSLPQISNCTIINEIWTAGEKFVLWYLEHKKKLSR
jgi:hypothetical protein